MASPPRAAVPASAAIALPSAEATTLDGDLPVTVREWRRAVKGYHRRSWLWLFLVGGLPVILFVGGALVMFRQLTIRLEDVYSVFFRQRLPRSTGPEINSLLAAFDLAEAVAQAQWWSVALIFGAIVGLAATVMGFLALLSRLVLKALPRTRADLRLSQQMARAQFRTVLPALWTAAGTYLIWTLWTALSVSSEENAKLDVHRLIDSCVALFIGIFTLLACSQVALVAASSWRSEAPREHLLRWLGRDLASLLVYSLLPSTILFVFGFLMPLQMAEIDRFVLTRLDQHVLEVAQSYKLDSPEELRHIVGDLSFRLHLKIEKEPLIRELLGKIPFLRMAGALSVLWLSYLIVLQACVSCLARGASRWVWSAAAVLGAVLLLAVLAGRAGPLFQGEEGIISITVYVVLACVATSADIFLNPASSPRRAAVGHPEELGLARVRLQEGSNPGAEATARARHIYERVGCALEGTPPG